MSDDNNQDPDQLVKTKLQQGIASLVIGLLIGMNLDLLSEHLGFDVLNMFVVSVILGIGGLCTIFQGLYWRSNQSGHKANNIPKIVFFAGGVYLVTALLLGMNRDLVSEYFELDGAREWIPSIVFGIGGLYTIFQGVSMHRIQDTSE